MTTQQSNEMKLEEEVQAVKDTGTLLKKLKLALLFAFVAILTLIIVASVLGQNAEGKNDEVKKLEIKIFSVEDVKQISKRIQRDSNAVKNELDTAEDLPPISKGMSKFSASEKPKVSANFPKWETTMTTFKSRIRQLYYEYPNPSHPNRTSDTLEYKFFGKYVAGLRGFGCHVKKCEFKAASKSQGVSTLRTCMSHCYRKIKVYGFTYNVGQNACYCNQNVKDPLPSFIYKSNSTIDFLLYTYPRFRKSSVF